MYDLLIRNGRIVDGTGSPAFYGDVAVKDGVIDLPRLVIGFLLALRIAHRAFVCFSTFVISFCFFVSSFTRTEGIIAAKLYVSF